MSTKQKTATDPIVKPEVFNKYADRLNGDNNLFVCDRCGHYAGDPRSQNFRARCPGCETLVKFYRIIA